jgi:Ca2+/Na+ antiporter
MLHPSKNEDGQIEDIGAFDAVLHFLSIGWKFLFALCPPPHYMGGWACFVVAIIFIGGITYVVGEIAGMMGCVMGIKPGVTAITFVAIGTSLPDTFASMTAAKESRYADSAVGNVTGSNSVNVFLGLGLPWVIGVIYSGNNNEVYQVPAKGLGISVVLFLCCSLVGMAILIIRRCFVGGELGGSGACKWISCTLLVSLWVAYIVVSTLNMYEIINLDF